MNKSGYGLLFSGIAGLSPLTHSRLRRRAMRMHSTRPGQRPMEST